MGELIFYQSDDGKSRVQFRAMDGNVWLNQQEMAELFATTKQNASLHIKNILAEGELGAAATVKESLTVQTSQLFFAEVQNKLLYAVTQHTAAEIIRDRADANAPNMVLASLSRWTTGVRTWTGYWPSTTSPSCKAAAN